MSIKPVLVPDHDAAALRGLIDRFADATTGPVKRQLTESVESGVTEGVKKMSPQQQHDFDRMRYGAMSRKEYDAKWKKPLKSDDEVIYGKKKSVAESQLDEIDRRGFLKGVGAAAVAGAAGGAKAQEFMTDRWSNDPISIRHSFLNLYVALSMIYKKYPDDQIIKKLTRVGFSIDTLESYKSAILKYIKQNPYEKDAVNNTIRAITRTNSSPEQGLESWMETLLKYPRQHQQKYDKFLSLINEFDESFQQKILNDFESLIEFNESVNQGVAEGSLTEFAPSDSGDGGGDDNGFDEDTLRKLAAQWFAGDEDPQVERLLAAAGWEIGQDEGYDDEPGVFVVMSGDDNGRSYMSWPAEEMRSAMSEGVSEDAAANNPVVNAITRRIVLQRTDLLSKYGPEKIGQAVDEVADFVGDVEEIGSSDVSGWVRHVEQMLGNREPDVTEQQVDELSPKTLGSYIKKSSADAAERQGEVTGRNQFGKGAEFAVKAFYGDRIQPHPQRNDPRIAKRQAGVDQAVDRLTAEDVAPAFKPGDRVMYLNGFATVVAQDGDAYGIRIDGKPGTQMVPADQIRKPSYDESVAESIDPVEQLRADIRRFAL